MQLADKGPGKRWGKVLHDGQGRTLYAYLNSQGRVMIRPMANDSNDRLMLPPKTQKCITAMRLVLWLTWGPPGPRQIACHYYCDNHRCLNPAHGRWGTHGHNRLEYKLLRTFKLELAKQPERLKERFIREHHPTRHMLAGQGFGWPTSLIAAHPV